MFSRLLGGIVGLAFAGMATAAQAVAYLLEYTGNNFTASSAPYTTDMSITGWEIIPFALPTDDGIIFAKQSATTSMFDLVNFSFTNGFDTITKGNGNRVRFQVLDGCRRSNSRMASGHGQFHSHMPQSTNYRQLQYLLPGSHSHIRFNHSREQRRQSRHMDSDARPPPGRLASVRHGACWDGLHGMAAEAVGCLIMLQPDPPALVFGAADRRILVERVKRLNIVTLLS